MKATPAILFIPVAGHDSKFALSQGSDETIEWAFLFWLIFITLYFFSPFEEGAMEALVEGCPV